MGRLLDAVARAAAFVAGAGVLAMMVHICADVGMRTLTGRPLPATVEVVSRYYMVAIGFLPLAWVERRGDMVSVELTGGFMGATLTRVSDAAVAAVSAAIYAVLTWTAWGAAMKAFGSKSFVIVLTKELPTWPTYFLVPAGFALATLVCLRRTVQCVTGAEAQA